LQKVDNNDIRYNNRFGDNNSHGDFSQLAQNRNNNLYNNTNKLPLTEEEKFNPILNKLKNFDVSIGESEEEYLNFMRQVNNHNSNKQGAGANLHLLNTKPHHGFTHNKYLNYINKDKASSVSALVASAISTSNIYLNNYNIDANNLSNNNVNNENNHLDKNLLENEDFNNERRESSSSVPRYSDPKYDFLKQENSDKIYKSVHSSNLFKSLLKKGK